MTRKSDDPWKNNEHHWTSLNHIHSPNIIPTSSQYYLLIIIISIESQYYLTFANVLRISGIWLKKKKHTILPTLFHHSFQYSLNIPFVIIHYHLYLSVSFHYYQVFHHHDHSQYWFVVYLPLWKTKFENVSWDADSHQTANQIPTIISSVLLVKMDGPVWYTI